jgi:hypothetical protein
MTTRFVEAGPTRFRRMLLIIAGRFVERLEKAQGVWARLMGTTQFSRLPVMCGSRDPSNSHPVAIRRGEMGYFLWTESKMPEEWNQDHGISPEQVTAMVRGSVLGWRSSEPIVPAQTR